MSIINMVGNFGAMQVSTPGPGCRDSFVYHHGIKVGNSYKNVDADLVYTPDKTYERCFKTMERVVRIIK